MLAISRHAHFVCAETGALIQLSELDTQLVINLLTYLPKYIRENMIWFLPLADRTRSYLQFTAVQWIFSRPKKLNEPLRMEQTGMEG